MRLLREPVIQFMLIGALIYGAYALFGQQSTDEADTDYTLLVTVGEVDWMVDSWTKKWNRPPTAEEKEGLINQHIEESILYREAVKMGLDKDDIIIRRRLSQKLRFLQEDLMSPLPPNDEELQVYFEKNIDKYIPEEMMTVTQIFFDPDSRGDETLTDAENAKILLMKMDLNSFNPGDFGDPFMLQNYYPSRTETEIAKLFGSEFARSVAALEIGKWHGPVLSGYGTHLVFVESHVVAEPPELSEVKNLVIQNWEEEKQEEFNDLFMQSLHSRYKVIVEGEIKIEDTEELTADI